MFNPDVEFHYKNRGRKPDRLYWEDKFAEGDVFAISPSSTSSKVKRNKFCMFFLLERKINKLEINSIETYQVMVARSLLLSIIEAFIHLFSLLLLSRRLGKSILSKYFDFDFFCRNHMDGSQT